MPRGVGGVAAIVVAPYSDCFLSHMSVREPFRLASPFWLVAWAVALAWCWLLPNHYLPWSAFHMDAWAAAALLPIAAAVVWRTRGETRVSVSFVLVLGLSALPWLQHAVGLITVAGTAWVAFAYLFGLGLAILVGQRWERHSPDQLGDGLCLAIALSAMLSVGLQLHQWLRLDLIEIWSMGNGFGRPYANFGQPNQLGTLLLWGILALGWGALRGQIRPAVLVVGIAYLLFGVALTASRTAWLGLLLLVLAVWYWRALWPWRPTPWVATGLAMVFFVYVSIIPIAAQALFLGTGEAGIDDLVRVSSELRPQAWALFLDAIWHKPWSGYGWSQTSMAQLAVSLDHPPLGIVFAHAHNLILDLLLYCGVPLGLFILGVLAIWLWRRFHAIKDATSALLFLFLVVIGNHAMLEFPLHYAYFLLPAGLVMGALDTRLTGRMVRFGQRWIAGVMWLASALLLSVMVRDYLRVEASYQALRFEWANFRTNNSRAPPDVLLLDQLRDMIIFARFEPSSGMSPEQLDWMRRVAGLYPNAGTVHKLATALVWNNQPDEAVLWFRRMCTMVPQSQCMAIRNALKKQAESDPRIAAVFWP